jgi:hypothetical protein
MTTKNLAKKSEPRQKPLNTRESLLRDQLKAEHSKRVQLCEALVFCAGVDHGELDARHDFLKRLCRVAADDLDTLAAALAGSAVENPKTPDFVSRLADRLRYAYAVEEQVRELFNEMQPSPRD